MLLLLKFSGRLKDKCPRIFYSITQIVSPLLLLIGCCFLFGSLIAHYEYDGEVSMNNHLIHISFDNGDLVTDVETSFIESGRNCASSYFDGVSDEVVSVNLTDFDEYMMSCGDAASEDLSNLQTIPSASATFTTSSVDHLEFGWISCPTSGPRTAHNLAVYAEEEWMKDFARLNKSYIQDGISEDEAASYASGNATGFANCGAHYSGGALFFFTIMTTIGYGTHTTNTTEGRVIVYIAGFFCVLLFTAVSSIAGNISLIIFDEFATHTLKYDKLTKGPIATLFWFTVFWAWIIIYGQLVYLSNKHDLPGDDTTKNHIWFSYITQTTIGLGDIAFMQYDFKTHDMFFIPYMTLFGFIVLANFLVKWSEWMTMLFPTDRSLEVLLEGRRNPKLDKSDILDVEEFGSNGHSVKLVGGALDEVAENKVVEKDLSKTKEEIQD